VTAADGYWLVSLGKGSPRVGSIRGPHGDGLTIRSPKVGLGPFFAILAISLAYTALLATAPRAPRLHCFDVANTL